MEGLTRFAYHLMDQKISLTSIHYATAIPVPTLSMYANGRRRISANHRPLIAAILSIPPDNLIGYCTTEVIDMSILDPEPAPEPAHEPAHGDTTPSAPYDQDADDTAPDGS